MGGGPSPFGGTSTATPISARSTGGSHALVDWCAHQREILKKPDAVVGTYVKSYPSFPDTQEAQEGARDKADLDGISDFAMGAIGKFAAEDSGRASALRKNLIPLDVKISSMTFRFSFFKSRMELRTTRTSSRWHSSGNWGSFSLCAHRLLKIGTWPPRLS